jgi:hypothetical protein
MPGVLTIEEAIEFGEEAIDTDPYDSQAFAAIGGDEEDVDDMEAVEEYQQNNKKSSSFKSLFSLKKKSPTAPKAPVMASKSAEERCGNISAVARKSVEVHGAGGGYDDATADTYIYLETNDYDWWNKWQPPKVTKRMHERFEKKQKMLFTTNQLVHGGKIDEKIGARIYHKRLQRSLSDQFCYWLPCFGCTVLTKVLSYCEISGSMTHRTLPSLLITDIDIDSASELQVYSVNSRQIQSLNK